MLNKSNLRKLVSEAPHQSLLIIDTNIALHQIDVLEYKSAATSLVVVLQTVLQEVRHRNLSVFRRMLTLLHDETRQFIFFPNEIAEATFSLRTQNEVFFPSPIPTHIVARLLR